ncbi:hypothetical protein OHA98_16705 [Streptomyces sp. NBC_00654]|uniref:hypothetical protein n=1 Tax=Streptomyces sp. NBC_00654 TaxID=2975799 RepID=UPI002257E575|nr:hypothetical protein [Streptomyces sp. NBC_00654]MCX4966445.1 hypothetical protein [Streptomyces sp. NBC_00654]
MEPFADLSAAFVFFVSPVRITVLDRLTWYVLEICDNRTEADIIAKVAALGTANTPDRARQIVKDRLQVLRDRGLLEVSA